MSPTEPCSRGSMRKMNEDFHWKTAITSVQPNTVRLRGYSIDDLMGKISFSQAIYLALKGELPSPEVGRLLDAIFVSSVDHGAGPPSVLAARTVASTGAELHAAVAAGVLAISRLHGGAIEEGMKLFQSVARRAADMDITEEAAAREILAEMKSRGERASGFGHRVHTQDPRTGRLFGLAEELKLAGPHLRIARTSRSSLRTAASLCRSTSTARSPRFSATSGSRPRSATPFSSSPGCRGSWPTSTRRRPG